MAESGLFRAPALQSWQRAHVVTAANCLREHVARVPEDVKLRAAYEGLLDLLDPSRMVAAVRAERRNRGRRASADRRLINLGSPGSERRSGIDRRSGRDRRAR